MRSAKLDKIVTGQNSSWTFSFWTKNTGHFRCHPRFCSNSARKSYFLKIQLVCDGRTDRPTNRPTDRPTNRRTDTPFYRDARTHLKIRNERLVRPDLSLAIWISNRMIVYQKSRPHLHSLSASPFYSFILHPSSILLSYHRNFVFCTPFFATNSTL